MESKPVLERPIEDRERADLFERHRPRLRGIAYRMLGSLGDAEDIVQEAYLRWHIWSSFRSRSGVINLWNRRAIGFRYTHRSARPRRRDHFAGGNADMRRVDRASTLGLGLGALAGALGIVMAAWHGASAPPAASAEGAKVTPVFAYDLPNLPGQKMTGVLVEYAPGGSSPPHHHTAKGSVVAYVLEGRVRSKVNDGPVTVYEAGQSWLEPPGAAHSVSANASATEPARLLAVFVAEAAPS